MKKRTDRLKKMGWWKDKESWVKHTPIDLGGLVVNDISFHKETYLMSLGDNEFDKLVNKK